jgi:hypothetical protein
MGEGLDQLPGLARQLVPDGVQLSMQSLDLPLHGQLAGEPVLLLVVVPKHQVAMVTLLHLETIFKMSIKITEKISTKFL